MAKGSSNARAKRARPFEVLDCLWMAMGDGDGGGWRSIDSWAVGRSQFRPGEEIGASNQRSNEVTRLDPTQRVSSARTLGNPQSTSECVSGGNADFAFKSPSRKPTPVVTRSVNKDQHQRIPEERK